MKSYFLEGIRVAEVVDEILSHRFPQQKNPWVLLSQDNDVIAYFDLVLASGTELDVPAIQVDISGRHFEKDEIVLEHLDAIRQLVGGRITSDQD